MVRSGHVADTVHLLRITDWTPIIRSCHQYPQETADEFYSFIKAAEDLCQPLKPFKARIDQPWMTASIQKRIAKRSALLRAGKHHEHKLLSESIEREIFIRKRKYTKRKFSLANPGYWKIVNDYRELKQAAHEDPALAKALNDGFYSVWNGVSQPDLSEYTASACTPPTSPLFTPANVSQSLKELNTSSPGPDGLSATLLKSARLELCDTIAYIFNAWLNTGFVPNQWRSATITPIAKIDHPSKWSRSH
jgi:hypothetical protein